MKRIALGCMLLSALCSGAARAHDDASIAFEDLKRLAGTWQPADRPDSKLRVEFELIAGDTVLTESWQAPGHASMTVYHLDGANLIATHYCPRGNQPRLAVSGRDATGAWRFEFRDGTGLDQPGEPYQSLLTLQLGEDGLLTRGENLFEVRGTRRRNPRTRAHALPARRKRRAGSVARREQSDSRNRDTPARAARTRAAHSRGRRRPDPGYGVGDAWLATGLSAVTSRCPSR